MNRLRSFALFVCFLALATSLRAQTESATVTGRVVDHSGAVIQKASVSLKNIDTGVTSQTETNNVGMYTFATVKPGRYLMHVERQGFQSVDVTGLTFYTQDQVARNFTLEVGSTAESVTVNGDDININTADAMVGTVVDRHFVEQIPLNGRSFQSLILLSPGVVTATPQGSDNSGDFSVNGLRTASNNYILDGVSAMNSPTLGGSGPGSTGSASSSTALGTTQAIISIDALQEFQIAASTYSAEFGRQPGAQISFTSRSGTNDYHGTAFEYLRNYAFDANNWFNDYSTPPLPKPQERQNDFGGVLGGPLSIPKVYSGKDRAFFFFSYEGLRLQQPTPSSIYYVPSNGTYNTSDKYASPLDKNLRANAPAAVQPALDGFPLPNCSTLQNPQCVDYGDGLSPFIISTTSPSTIDAIMARVDVQPLSWVRMFARYSDTESSSQGLYYGSSMTSTVLRTRAFLLGADSVFHSSMTNQLRLQYSPAYGVFSTTDQSVGGSIPVGGPQAPNLNTMQGLPPVGGKTAFELPFGSETGQASPHLFDLSYGSRQFQPNAVDTMSWTHGTHFFKAGVDYRQTTTYLGNGNLSYGPLLYYFFKSGAQVLNNALYEVESSNILRQDPTAKNLGLFFQDEWRVHPRLSLSLGLRWDFNPPPSISGAQQYTYTGNINNPSSMALSRLGAPLYKTTYTDFGPRVGMAFAIYNQPGRELVLRAGGGLFYDTGQSSIIGTIADGVSLGSTNFQEFGSVVKKPQEFPLTANVILEPVNTTPAPPYTLDYILAPDFVPPSAVECSASLEQALGPMQSLILGYVGTEGRGLSVLKEYSLSNLNPLFKTVEEYENGPGSTYNSLQVQYKRQPLHGLQTLASYTWAHAIDSASTDYSNLGIDPPQRGNSDHDIRNNFTAALIYNVPTQYAERWQRAILGYWSTDLRFVARTAFPVQPLGATVIDPASGDEYPSRLNYNGAYPYVQKAGVPGGRQFNPAVFSVALADQIGNAPRNFLRGFGEDETDMAIQRVFPLHDQTHLQFRAEAFNVFNHPNFGTINVACGATKAGATCNNSLLGQATSTLSNSTFGTLSSIYQQGGPRSLQFALKLQF